MMESNSVLGLRELYDSHSQAMKIEHFEFRAVSTRWVNIIQRFINLLFRRGIRKSFHGNRHNIGLLVFYL
jgi:hypothetical protein